MRTLALGSFFIGCLAGCLLTGCGESKEAPPEEHTQAGDTLRATTKGAVVGFHDEENTSAWLGIPFAQAPVGNLRWQAPQPAAPWSAVRPALEFQNFCSQLGGMATQVPKEQWGKLVGAEDCLYLNVWSPRTATNTSTRLPVMVWLYGGGNTVGSSNSYTDVRVLAGRQQVVAVTLNYRLGAFGWFHHPALAAADAGHKPERAALNRSGNFGTLDIIQALHWVQENIAAFGGDPNNVTVFGESAGGTNVYSLLLSPAAKGLFHKGIAQSGGIITVPVSVGENYVDETPAGHPRSAKELAVALLLADGAAKNRDDAKAWLNNHAATEVAAYLRSKTPTEIFAQLGDGPVGMVDVPKVFGDGYVLPADSPRDLLDKPELFNAVPLIAGTNRDEMKMFQSGDPYYVSKWFGVIPHIRDEEDYDRMARYGSNVWQLFGANLPATTLTGGTASPVFVYRFEFDQLHDNWLVETSRLIGAAHGLEISYAFGVPGIAAKKFPINTEETLPARQKLAHAMSSYWANFAYTGAPGRGRQNDLPLWQPWSNTEGAPKSLVIDADNRGGIRMADQPLTVARLKQELRADATLRGDQEAWCRTYAKLFYKSWLAGSSLFDEKEYATLGEGGCGAYPPQNFL